MHRIAAFGGVSANPYALEAVLADARTRGCDELVCDAVWAPLLREGVQCIAGDHDLAIGRGDADCGCSCSDERDNALTQVMYDHTRRHTSPVYVLELRRADGSLPEAFRCAV